MNTSSHLSRALGEITVQAHRAIRSREHQKKYYALTEREQQYQNPVNGNIGSVACETTLTVYFDIAFIYDYGYLRDSQLLEPLVRFGFSQCICPAGTVPYAYIKSWIQDQDLSYTGANITVGVHNPTASIAPAEITGTAFSFTLHTSIQGFGAPIDPIDITDS